MGYYKAVKAEQRKGRRMGGKSPDGFSDPMALAQSAGYGSAEQMANTQNPYSNGLSAQAQMANAQQAQTQVRLVSGMTAYQVALEMQSLRPDAQTRMYRISEEAQSALEGLSPNLRKILQTPTEKALALPGVKKAVQCINLKPRRKIELEDGK